MFLLTETKLCVTIYRNRRRNGNPKGTILTELLTESEINVLSKRWRILKLLQSGTTQRQIAKELQVSLCKVTRGAKILNNKKAVITKILEG